MTFDPEILHEMQFHLHEMQFHIDKKWKYLRFHKDPDSLVGWNLAFSDEPSGVSRDSLLSAEQVSFFAHKDETFYLVFAAMVSDPQLVECSDGLHQISEIGNGKTNRRRWQIFPLHWNRDMWKQFSHHARTARRWEKNLTCHIFLWMNVRQLEQAKRLMIEALDMSNDLSALDSVLAYKKSKR